MYKTLSHTYRCKGLAFEIAWWSQNCYGPSEVGHDPFLVPGSSIELF